MQSMIHIKVVLFGPAVDAVGESELEYALVPPASLSTLADLLFAKYPKLGEASSSLRLAVNGEFTEMGAVLNEGDEVAVIPPVAGGGEDAVVLTREPIDVAALFAKVADDSCGAMVAFTGTVRTEGPADDPLVAMEYSAYDSMAIEQMRRLRQAAIEGFDVHDVAITHRVGQMAVGETSVAIVVSAPHREAAFDAGRWVIDQLKRDVPVWKKEIWSRGRTTWAKPNE